MVMRMMGAAMPMVSKFGSRPTKNGRQAHEEDGDEEGVLAADEVAEAAEDDGAERADEEAGGEGEQGEDEEGSRSTALKNWRDDRGERAVEIEVVPLEDRAERGGEDDLRSSLVMPV